MTGSATQEWQRSLAAIQTSDGATVGAGFLVTGRHVLTCAHVVNAAVGTPDDEAARPTEPVLVQFPLSAPGRPVPASVTGWVPVDKDGGGDIALLELAEDPASYAHPAPLVDAGDAWGHAFRALGFPVGHPAGLWASGVIRSPLGNGWVQLEDVKVPGERVEGGFSGGAIFDEQVQAVVGMAVAQDRQENRKIGFMIPLAVLARAVPTLTSLAARPGPLSNVLSLPPHFVARPDEVAPVKTALLAGLAAVRPRQFATGGDTADGNGDDGARLAGDGSVARGPWLAIVGMGGAGKSVLAATVSRDDEVRAAFPDGIAWIELGQAPAVAQRQAQLAEAFHVADAAFADAQQGKAYLTQRLAGLRCLVVLDNVWSAEHLGAFDVLGPGGRLLVTTRDAGLARAVGATRHDVGLLNDEQALKLLAQWAGQLVQELPAEAATVARECGNLALALAMVGAMIEGRPERWALVLRRLQRADLDKISQSFAGYPHPDLLRAISISVDALAPDERKRYLELAVFDGHRPTRAAIEVLWEPVGLDDLDTQQLLDRFADRSLARFDAEGRLLLHDLQMDYVRHQSTHLRKFHVRLVTGYARRAPGGWPSGPNDGYYFESLGYHLVEAKRREELLVLLLDLPWLSAKLAATGVSALLADYDLVDDSDAAIVRDALRLSSHVLVGRPGGLAAQLIGRLADRPSPRIERLVGQARNRHEGPWLCPASASLTRPGGPMLRSLVGHTGWVRTVALSGDGRLAVSGSDDGTVRVWDLRDGTERYTLRGHDSGVWSVAVTPDGRLAVSGSLDGTVRVWDLETGGLVHILRGHDNSVWTVALTPDGALAVSGGADGTAHVWDLRDGAPRAVLRGHGGAVMHAVIGQDGRLLVTKSEDGTLRTWRLPTGTAGLCLDSGERHVRTSGVAVTDRHALFAGDGGAVYVWDLRDGGPTWTLAAANGVTWAVAVTGDGRYAVSSSAAGSLLVWDLETGGLVRTLRGHAGWVGVLVMTPDGRRVLSGGDDAILRLWDISDGREVAALCGHGGWILAAAITRDGQRIVSASSDATLRVWDLANIAALATADEHSGWVGGVAIVAGDPAAAMPATVISASDDATVRVWDVGSGAQRAVFRGHGAAVTGFAVSHDGALVVSGSADGTVRCWRHGQADSEQVMTAGAPVTAVALADGDRYAVAGTVQGTLCVWDLRSGAGPRVLDTGEPVQVLCTTSDGRMIFTGGVAGTAGVWAADTGANQQVFRGRGGPILTLAVPNGQQVLTGCIDGYLTSWDLVSGRLLWERQAHESLLSQMAVLGSDDKRIATGGGDGAVRVWRVADGALVADMKGTGDAVRAVATAPNGRWVIAAAANVAVLWDVSTGREVARFDGDAGISATAISDDGLVVCGEATGAVHLLTLIDR